MAYGKEVFRNKYRETNQSIEKIKKNYYDLDSEYQIVSHRIDKVIEYIEKRLLPYGDEWHWDDAYLRDMVEVVLEELKGEDKE